MARKKDLTGDTFGWLTALEPGEMKWYGKKRRLRRGTWKCKCICGKIVQVLTCNLLKGNSTSCGCKFLKSVKYNFTDLTGKTYGKLTVIKKSDKKTKTKTRGLLWECQCDCGKRVFLPSNSLTSGNTTCCKSASCRKAWRRVGEIPLSHVNHIRQNAIKRNLPFSVSNEYLWELFLSQNRQCALSKEKLTFTDAINAQKGRSSGTNASLDRIDNNKGYIEGNIRWIHKDLNRMRWKLDDKDFLEWCRKCFLEQYRNKRPSFDEYFMMLAFDVATRSEDLHIKHGAVITNRLTNHILGTGYNGTIRGSDKTIINLADREARRPWMIHAEENAIMNCERNPLTLEKTAIYITGWPCVSCLQRIINFGIKEIFIADRPGTVTENKDTLAMRQHIIDMYPNVIVHKMHTDNFWVRKSAIF